METGIVLDEKILSAKPEGIAQRRSAVDQAFEGRFKNREGQRQKKQQDIDTNGIAQAAGMDAMLRRVGHMTVAEGRNLESIIGGNDLDGVNFLERGSRAARAVCRLAMDGSPVGTGFLVAPGIVMTNNHVIGSLEDAKRFKAEFDYQMDLDDQPRPVIRFQLDPDKLFVTSPKDQLDFSIIALRPLAETGESIARYGWLPLDPAPDKVVEGEPIVLVEHPSGNQKQICLFHSELLDKLDDFIHYTTDSEACASGSPCLNRHWQVAGLHHASASFNERRHGAQVTANEGIRISQILAALQSGDRVKGNCKLAYQMLTSPDVAGNGRPMPENPAPARTISPERLSRTRIAIHDASHFQGREGYKPDFINSRLPVPMPALNPAWLQDAAPVVGSQNLCELKYTHFSVIVSASRRMPIVTAANIDGAKWVNLSRTDRNPGIPEPTGVEEEAADRWFYDGRIPLDDQLGPEIYDRTAFDFGHMVRRQDPIWGSPQEARAANDDTFHMTNCTTQHHDLNTRTWLALEDAILGFARDNRQKVCVFTGPVLSQRDPEVLGVQVPVAFWKIVAFEEEGRLRACGFMQWQRDMVADIQAGLESMARLDRVQEYRVPIADIARETGLDFGPLLQADDIPQGQRQRLDESLTAGIFRVSPVYAGMR